MEVVLILDDERDIETHRSVFDLNLLKMVHKGAEVVYARSSAEFMTKFIKFMDTGTKIAAISFDHDLQDFQITHSGGTIERKGTDCVYFIRDQLFKFPMIGRKFLEHDTKFFVHSQNPIGAKAINDCINYDIIRFIHGGLSGNFN